jgi:hypothetical protein
MTKGIKLRLLGVVSSRGEASAYIKSPGDAILVERGRPRLLLLSCPCGCGEHFPINLDPRAGPAWRLYRNRRSGLTLFPSVWRESGCCSHYVIWRDKIILFGQYEEEWDESSLDDDSLPNSELVRAQLPVSGLIPFPEIADAIDALPWDVLKVCRRLVRAGVAHEGRGKERGLFGRV